MSINIGPKISLDGEAEFKTAIKNAAAAVRTLDAELEASKQQFSENADSTEALTSQNEILQNKSEVLTQKLSHLKAEYDRVSEAQGQNSAAALKLRTDIAKTNTELGKTEQSLEKNNEKISQNTAQNEGLAGVIAKLIEKLKGSTDEIKNSSEALDEAGNKASAFSGKAAPAFDKAKTAAIATSAAIVGITTALAKLTLDTAASVDELNTLSTTTGISTQQLQQLEYASKFVDVSVDTMTKSIKEIGKQMGEALKNPSGDAAAAFSQLGVEVTNIDGSLRNSKDVWEDVLASLGNVTNETERTNLAMKLMSEEANQLNGIMGADGVNALDRYSAEAQKSGYVMSNNTLTSLQRLNDEYDRAKLQLEATKNKIAEALAPELTELAQTFTKVVEAATPFIVDGLQWILDHGSQIAQVIGLVVGGLIGFKIASTLTSLMSSFNGVMAMTNATMLANPAVWIAAAVAVAVAALASALLIFAANSAKTVEAVGSVGQEIEEGIKDAETSVKAFNEGMTKVIDTMDWSSMKNSLSSGFSSLADSAAESFSERLAQKLKNLDATIENSLPKSISFDVETNISNVSRINSSIGFSGFGEGFTGSNMMTDFINALKSIFDFPTAPAGAGMSGAIPIQFVVDGRVLAEALWDPFNEAAARRGKNL